ncbi:MAG: tRNA (adenosine(37)-N6)-dimethylallyltransferase MiaA [Planctomycetes bacterium]|nr:tRNA (adenosine(37)-N6)-dimethylallyltransferase MiaA [Planctomycetota bacterium]
MQAKRTLILGVTGSGKGALGFELARRMGGEIISVDSMKVYRRMDIGTAKPSIQRQGQVPYHLIDVAQPSESFSVDRFLALTEAAAGRIEAAGRPVIAVGGTAMYIKAMLYGLFEGPAADMEIRERLKQEIAADGSANLHSRLAKVDPQAAERIHPNDQRRIIRALEVFELTGKPISSLQTQFEAQNVAHGWRIIGLRREKADASSRINARVKRMIDGGLVDEVKGLLAEEMPLSRQAACAIGYAEIIEHLQGPLALDEAIERIKVNTRRLAKGQRTWFKTFKDVNWLDIDSDESAESILKRAAALPGL